MSRVSTIFNIVRKKAIVFSAGFVLFLVIVNEGIVLYNNRILKDTTLVNQETQEVKLLLTRVWNEVVRNIDLGLRGYALTQDEGLLVPYNNGVSLYKQNIVTLEEKLKAQGYPKLDDLKLVRKGYEGYLEFSLYLIDLVKKDSMSLFKDELKKDKGLALWKVYEKFCKDVELYEDQLSKDAADRYNNANTRLTIVQILLGITGIPTLLFMMFRFFKDERERLKLFEELEQNNRKYLFDPGTPLDVKNERALINNSIVNFQKAATFISQISVGNFQVDWEELSEKNKSLNQTNLAGELVQMREKMKQLKSEDGRRMWSTEGQAKFSEIIRSYQHDLKTLCDESISFIVKYLDAQQGAVFLVRENEDDKYLELQGCFAFNKRKHVEKRVEIGQGLVGQAYLEQQTVKLTEIPQGYTFITSGLGEATPSCLLIVPMKYNEKVEAVIEIAGFQVYDAHQVEWMNKIGEIMASTLISLKTTETTQNLLEQFKEQAEQLKAQEEELRQNMEEMEATQEEMRRKEQELERRQSEMQDLLDKKK